jgi:protein PhnA
MRSIMDDGMKCPKCNSEHAYPDGDLWVCPECAHEWSAGAGGAAAAASDEPGVRDAHGNPLADGDSVIVMKDLKVKGSSSTVKGGTKPGTSASPRRPTDTTSPARSTASAR